MLSHLIWCSGVGIITLLAAKPLISAHLLKTGKRIAEYTVDSNWGQDVVQNESEINFLKNANMVSFKMKRYILE